MMNIFKLARIALVLAIAMSLAACGNINDGAVERRMADNEGRMQTNGVGTLNNGQFTRDPGVNSNNLHQNTRVEMSQELADRIADMVEVDSANVLLTNQNAYIAVVLADDAGEGRLGNIETNRSRSTSNTKRMNNKNNNNAKDQKLRQNRDANRDDMRLDNTRMRRQYSQAADVTSILKDKITKEVKNHAPHILNVYVSANPDFGDRMNGFIDQLQSGHPVKGLINEVNTTFERMFPTNNAPNISPDTAPRSVR